MKKIILTSAHCEEKFTGDVTFFVAFYKDIIQEPEAFSFSCLPRLLPPV